MKAALTDLRNQENEELCRRTPSAALCFAMFLLITLLSCSSGKTLSKEKDRFAGEGYRLVWADEFNNNGAPDTANWQHEKGFVRNEETQWYQTENAFCKDGLL